MHCSAASARSPPTPRAIAADIDGAHEVLGEALQTALRAAGVPNGYELLKDFTRGADVDAASLAAFIDKLPLPAADRTRLKALTPAEYIGLAARDGALDLRPLLITSGFP